MFLKRWLGFLTALSLGVAGIWWANTAASPTQAAPSSVTMTVTDTTDSFFPDGLCSLREAIHNANTNTQAFGGVGECPQGSAVGVDIIVLPSNAMLPLTISGSGDDQGDLDILSNGLPLDLRIETDGADQAIIMMTIMGQRVMEIHPNANVELSNIQLRNGSTADAGGGIYHQGAYLGLDHVLIRDNAANSGGGIYNQNGVVEITNSVIESNNGALGGAGLLNSSGVVTITNTALLNNIANGGSGGAIANAGTLTIGDNTTISGNQVGLMGGGIYNQAGGTIHMMEVTMVNNTADQGAGLYNDEGTVTIANSSVVINTAQNGGGGLYNRDVMTVTQSIVRANTTVDNGSNGGGIYNDGGHLTIESQSAVNLNQADAQGGGIYSTAGNLTLTDSEVTGNISNGSGGGIYHTDAGDNVQLVVQNSTITENTTTSGNGGGVYHARYSYFTEVSISGNSATVGSGGGLFTPFTTHWVEGSITGNQAGTSGGGLWVASLDAEKILVGENQALGTHGGGIRAGFVDKLENATIMGNFAQTQGGGLYLNNGTNNSIAHTTFASNTALSEGGAIYLATDKHLTLYNSTLSGNMTAGGSGAGLLIATGSIITATNVTVIENAPGENIYKQGELTLQNSIIADCVNVATPINSLGHNIAADNTCTGLTEPSDMVDTDPMLGLLANNGGDTQTRALQSGSPAIGAGNTAVCAAAPINGIDQRGFMRDTTACDIGAYEYGLTFTIGLEGDGVGNVNGKGIDCGDGGTDCTIKHEHGDNFPLEATAAAGSVFVGWSGDLSGTTTPVTVTINTPLHITATFNLIRHTLTVAKAGTGAGTVTSNPAGITCGATCAADFVEGEIVTLTAVASAGSEFTGWTGAVVSSDASIDVTMDEAKSVTANFNLLPGNFLLTVAKAGTGSGTVTSDPAGIACGATCAAGFVEDTVVTLTAVTGPNSTFAGWSGAVTGNTPTIQVTVDAAKQVTATFNLVEHTLTVAKAGSGAGQVASAPAGINCGATCSADFAHDTIVTLTAAVGTGSTFVGWTGAVVSSDPSIQVTMDEAKSVTATFDLLPGNVLLTVTKAGSGSGVVTSAPAGIACGNSCNAGFATDTLVTLTATADAGSVFVGWSGAATGDTATIQVTMDTAKNITATFEPEPTGFTIFLPLISR